MYNIQTYMFKGKINPNKTYTLGDICIDENNNTYVYSNIGWETLYENDLNIKTSIKILPKICSRCGAPLKNHICEYCGTRY